MGSINPRDWDKDDNGGGFKKIKRNHKNLKKMVKNLKKEKNNLNTEKIIKIMEEKMADKFGPYINRLMTTIIDKEQEEFVQDLAWNELKRLNADVEEFLRNHLKDDVEEIEKTEKILLNEQKQTKKNKE